MSRAAGWRLGIDAGGTFVDLLAVHDDGRTVALKVPSTPASPAIGPLQGIARMVQRLAPEPVVEIAHGTTVGLNALLERRFPRVALIVTRGFRHVLEIARHSVPGQWGAIYSWVKPQRVVPLEWVLEVDERVGASGEVVEALDEASVESAIARIEREGIRTVAVCLLHSYRDGRHEQRIGELLAARLPGTAVSLSSEIIPEFREYERMVTTAMNAVLAPLVGQYLAEFATGAEQRTQRVASDGAPSHARVFVMRSAGGVVDAEEAARQPLRTALSGPAGGVLGMSRLALQAGFDRALTFDMGGTSTDVAAVEHGRPQLTTEAYIDVYPLRAPTIDLATIGAGGGSVIAVGAGRRLLVGPRSAGAMPGPACYGRGGLGATVTDANLVLGRLPPALLDGEVALDVAAARGALESVGHALGLDAVATARSALQIVTHNMAGAVRQVSIRRGIDPRGYVLVAFGGAGPVHAADLARILEIPRVLVPPLPGLGSCNGLLLADVVIDDVKTQVLEGDDLNCARIAPIVDALDARLARRAAGLMERAAAIVPVTSYGVDLRYAGMGSELRVEATREELLAPGFQAVLSRFHQQHHRLFGYDYAGRHSVHALAWRASLELPRYGRIGQVHLPESAADEVRPVETRRMWIDVARGFEDVPVFRRAQLPAGWTAAGPFVVDQYDTTTCVLPGQHGAVDAFGNLILETRM